MISHLPTQAPSEDETAVHLNQVNGEPLYPCFQVYLTTIGGGVCTMYHEDTLCNVFNNLKNLFVISFDNFTKIRN